MIIVSQNKNAILNFDNVTTIKIDSSNLKGSYEIIAGVNNGHFATLAEYETEKRAKEILQEIINKYMEYATISNLAGIDVRQICVIPKKYEMPKE